MADLKNTPCASNDFFIIDCNRCSCNHEGTGYACTQNICQSITTQSINVGQHNLIEQDTHVTRHNNNNNNLQQETRQKREYLMESYINNNRT